MSDDLFGTVQAALDDEHGWDWISAVSGEWTWKSSTVRDWLRTLLNRYQPAEADNTASASAIVLLLQERNAARADAKRLQKELDAAHFVRAKIEDAPLAAARAEADRLREALVGFVGSDDPTELDAIEAVIRGSGAPESDKAQAINGIDALRQTRRAALEQKR